MSQRAASMAVRCSASLWRHTCMRASGRPKAVRSLRVAHGVLHHELHRRHRLDRRHQPLALEVRHHVVEALVLLAEEVARRDAAVLEEEDAPCPRRGCRPSPAYLRDLEARRVGGEEEEREPLVPARRRCGPPGEEVRPGAVGDPRLRRRSRRSSSPSRRAVVRMAATSDPASGSEMASAAIRSPRMAGARNSRFCSSVPSSPMTGMAISPWTSIAMLRPALPAADQLLGVGDHVPVVEPGAAPRRVLADAEEAQLAEACGRARAGTPPASSQARACGARAPSRRRSRTDAPEGLVVLGEGLEAGHALRIPGGRRPRHGAARAEERGGAWRSQRYRPRSAFLRSPSAGSRPSQLRNIASAKSFPGTVTGFPSPAAATVVPSPGT